MKRYILIIILALLVVGLATTTTIFAVKYSKANNGKTALESEVTEYQAQVGEVTNLSEDLWNLSLDARTRLMSVDPDLEIADRIGKLYRLLHNGQNPEGF